MMCYYDIPTYHSSSPHPQGLEDQLLALVVEHERPDLQEQARQLVRQLNEYNITLTDLENGLLFKLANSQVCECVRMWDMRSYVTLVCPLESILPLYSFVGGHLGGH